MFIDTHAHLNFKAFNEDYKEVIKRAFDANVKGIINVGSNLETSQRSIEIAHEHNANLQIRQLADANAANNSNKLKSYDLKPNIYATVGLHPIHVADEQFDFNKYLKLAKDPKVVAIGETGADLYHNNKTIDLQRDVFEKSLKIASQVQKPVILHCRQAEEDMRAWLMGQQNLPKGVMHCFSGDLEFANFVLDLGLLISFTGVITFTKNQKTMEVIRKIPLEKIMIETDCPFLTPRLASTSDSESRRAESHRSQPIRQVQGPHAKGVRNEPAFVIEVAKKIAEIKKIPLKEVEKQTTKSAIELFNLNP